MKTTENNMKARKVSDAIGYRVQSSGTRFTTLEGAEKHLESNGLGVREFYFDKWPFNKAPIVDLFFGGIVDWLLIDRAATSDLFGGLEVQS